jgi:hypothetical protein
MNAKLARTVWISWGVIEGPGSGPELREGRACYRKPLRHVT